jgi:hypothetical protein
MSSNSHRINVAKRFKEHQAQNANNRYTVATEVMSVDDKLKVLEELGYNEMIDLFKDWKPRVSNRKRRGAPLDQRVSITVTTQERVSLDQELKAVKAAGEKITMSQFIRNRALGTVDINGWREIAEKTLKEIEDTVKNQSFLRQSKLELAVLMDEEDDADEVALYANRIAEINAQLNRLVAQNEKRNNRLSGRMSMPEAETVKWRAQRLCISSSDYLRMMIFGLEPNSTADAHMSLDAKRRFYVSIIEVANNGWGTPPAIYECSQCVNYMDEIRKLRAENEQLRQFA